MLTLSLLIMTLAGKAEANALGIILFAVIDYFCIYQIVKLFVSGW